MDKDGIIANVVYNKNTQSKSDSLLLSRVNNQWQCNLELPTKASDFNKLKAWYTGNIYSPNTPLDHTDVLYAETEQLTVGDNKVELGNFEHLTNRIIILPTTTTYYLHGEGFLRYIADGINPPTRESLAKRYLAVGKPEVNDTVYLAFG